MADLNHLSKQELIDKIQLTDNFHQKLSDDNQKLKEEIKILNKHNLYLIETVAHQKRVIEANNQMTGMLNMLVWEGKANGKVRYASPSAIYADEEERKLADIFRIDFQDLKKK